MQLLPLSLSCAILAGLLNYFTMRYGIVTWPAFVGWAIYFLLGSNKEAIVKALPPMVAGILLGYLTVISFTALKGDSLILSGLVVIFAFILVFMMNIPWLAAAPAAFLSAACYFGVGDPVKTIIPMVIGLFMGYISIWIPEKIVPSQSSDTTVNS